MYSVIEWLTTHKRTVVVGLLLFAFVMLSLLLFFRTDRFTVTRLNIRSDNMSLSIDGTTLRAHNGAFFYKKSLTDNTTPEVLGGGVKLPGITHALWAGDKGVILNFDQSFIRTAVEEISNQNNLSYEERARSTWYFDFSDNSLRHVGSYMLYSKSHYFDSKENVLYYLEADEGLALHAFDTTTKQDQIIPLSVQFGSITQLDKCHNSEKLCITGKTLGSPSSTSVYSVTAEGTTKKEFTVDGEFYSILGSPYGLSLERQNLIPIDEEDSMVEYKKGTLINMNTGKKIEINKRLTPDNFLYTTYGDSGDKLAVVGGDSDENYTTAKQLLWSSITQSGRLSYSNGDAFKAGVIIDSEPTANSLLLKTTKGEYGIFAPSGYVQGNFSREDSNTAIKASRACMNSVANARAEYDSELNKITLLIPDNKSFASNVLAVNQCLTKETTVLYGYDFSFTSYDPESGKMTSY